MPLLELKDGTVIDVNNDHYRVVPIEEIQQKLADAQSKVGELQALLPVAPAEQPAVADPAPQPAALTPDTPVAPALDPAAQPATEPPVQPQQPPVLS
jgi:hypothetical protein